MPLVQTNWRVGSGWKELIIRWSRKNPSSVCVCVGGKGEGDYADVKAVKIMKYDRLLWFPISSSNIE